jgi:hypothetical protein
MNEVHQLLIVIAKISIDLAFEHTTLLSAAAAPRFSMSDIVL